MTNGILMCIVKSKYWYTLTKFKLKTVNKSINYNKKATPKTGPHQNENKINQRIILALLA